MKLALQIALALVSLIPAYFAFIGIYHGAGLLTETGEVAAAVDNQFRYQSATYLMMTFALWYIIPKVEKHGTLLGLISLVFFIGGIARYVSVQDVGPGTEQQHSAMFVEFGLPVLWLWQRLVARQSA